MGSGDADWFAAGHFITLLTNWYDYGQTLYTLSMARGRLSKRPADWSLRIRSFFGTATACREGWWNGGKLYPIGHWTITFWGRFSRRPSFGGSNRLCISKRGAAPSGRRRWGRNWEPTVPFRLGMTRKVWMGACRACFWLSLIGVRKNLADFRHCLRLACRIHYLKKL